MKLWKKISIIILLFIIVAILLTSITITSRFFDAFLEQEKQKDISIHYSYEELLSNKIAYERSIQNTLTLSDEDVEALIITLVDDISDQWIGIAVYEANNTNDDCIHNYQGEFIQENIEFRTKVAENKEELSLQIDSSGEESYILIGTVLSLENKTYYLYTVHYITEMYVVFEEQISYISIFIIVLGCIAALIILFTMTYFLRPLKELNYSLEQLTKGDYRTRIPKLRGQEFQIVSDNVNIMAESIESHINKLEHIAESRKSFVDNFAHEMKTPLTSILCMGDLIRIKKNITETEKIEYATIIVDEATRMKNLSSKLLEMATIDKVQLDRKYYPITELFSYIYDTYSPIFIAHQMTLEIHPVDANVYGDQSLILSLLYNLLENAMKASKDGDKIILSSSKSNFDYITFSVRDCGIGMSKADKEKVTEAFYMVNKSRTRANGGAGLGLSLCQEIVKSHGGTLEIKSKLKKGTVVSATFPNQQSMKEDS